MNGKYIIALQQLIMQGVLPYNKRLVGFSVFFLMGVIT